jgi:hypothetical protein
MEPRQPYQTSLEFVDVSLREMVLSYYLGLRFRHLVFSLITGPLIISGATQTLYNVTVSMSAVILRLSHIPIIGTQVVEDVIYCGVSSVNTQASTSQSSIALFITAQLLVSR